MAYMTKEEIENQYRDFIGDGPDWALEAPTPTMDDKYWVSKSEGMLRVAAHKGSYDVVFYYCGMVIIEDPKPDWVDRVGEYIDL